MSSLIKIRKNKSIKRFKENREIMMSVFILLIFLIVSAMIIKNINPAKEDVPDYFELSKNPYVKYEKLLNRADLKKIMDSRQFLEMKYDEDVIKKEDSIEKEDPFAERFGDEDEGGENGKENKDASKKEGGEKDNEERNSEN